jgi:hypothetical protein
MAWRTPSSAIASNSQDRIDFTTTATGITPMNDSHGINVENPLASSAEYDLRVSLIRLHCKEDHVNDQVSRYLAQTDDGSTSGFTVTISGHTTYVPLNQTDADPKREQADMPLQNAVNSPQS